MVLPCRCPRCSSRCRPRWATRSLDRDRLRRRRPRNHGRLARRRCDHRDRRRAVPRPRADRLVPDPRRSGTPDPPYIAHLTGIDDRVVAGAPALSQILPSFLEFARGAVIVAHNATFDVGFLNANLLRLDYEVLRHPRSAPPSSPGDSSGPTCPTSSCRRSRPISGRARNRSTVPSRTPRPPARSSRSARRRSAPRHPDAG